MEGIEEFRMTLTPEERERLPGYLEMAADKEREAEAKEWCDVLGREAFMELERTEGPWQHNEETQ